MRTVEDAQSIIHKFSFQNDLIGLQPIIILREGILCKRSQNCLTHNLISDQWYHPCPLCAAGKGLGVGAGGVTPPENSCKHLIKISPHTPSWPV